MASAKDILAGLGTVAGVWLAWRWVSGQPPLPTPARALPEAPHLTLVPGGLPKDGVVPDFEPVLFDHDSADFPPVGYRSAQAFARWIIDHPGWVALVVGHDVCGQEPGKCLNLSRDRALAAAEVLVRHGVPEERVQIDALGDKHPVAPDTEEGRAYNRRVEFVAVAA